MGFSATEGGFRGPYQGGPAPTAAAAIGCFLGTIAGHVGKGGKVTLVGFGTFSQKVRKARTGRNPQTGAAIKIGASKSMGFKASKAGAAKKAAPKKAAKKK